MKEIIEKFISEMPDDLLYNEAGLQYELGVYLRSKGANVKFEYNIDSVLGDVMLLKKEMDLYFGSSNGNICIEIKFPTNGAYPRRMTQSIIDLIFLQQLLDKGFTQSYFIFISSLKGFFEGREYNGIYSFFRSRRKIADFSIEDIPNFMRNGDTEKLIKLLEVYGNPIQKNYRLDFIKRGEYQYCVLKMEN